jgi:RND family efflux transporter MFP subunit
MQKSDVMNIFRLGLAFLIFWTISGCKKEAPPPKERIRALKTITVTHPASGHVRTYPGLVEPVDKSSISFEVSGNVQKVLVDVGDKVSQGQLLATMDTRTFKLDVEAAEAALGRSRVELSDKKKDIERFRRINKLDPGAVSQMTLDQAQAAYEGAGKDVSFSRSQLNLAKRDLEKTELRAPFDGVIAERMVEPFFEVSRGQAVFNVFIEGAMEVAITIPESEIEGVGLGLRADIRFPTIPGQAYHGVVSKVGSVANQANAFPVNVAISDSSEKVRPGISAEVTLMLAGTATETSFLVPISVISAGESNAQAVVYVFDPETSTVQKRTVTLAGIRDNNVIVKEGLESGEIIAVAGVSFLQDGQKVTLME